MTTKFAARAADAVAACASVGLTYWADHPSSSSVWAADFDGRFHQVRIDRKAGTAHHVCRTNERYSPGDNNKMRAVDSAACTQSKRTGSWNRPTTLDHVSLLLGGDTHVEPWPETSRPAAPTLTTPAKPARRTTTPAKRKSTPPAEPDFLTVALINADESNIAGMDTECLRLARGHTDRDQAIDDELRRREGRAS